MKLIVFSICFLVSNFSLFGYRVHAEHVFASTYSIPWKLEVFSLSFLSIAHYKSIRKVRICAEYVICHFYHWHRMFYFVHKHSDEPDHLRRYNGNVSHNVDGGVILTANDTPARMSGANVLKKMINGLNETKMNNKRAHHKQILSNSIIA